MAERGKDSQNLGHIFSPAFTFWNSSPASQGRSFTLEA